MTDIALMRYHALALGLIAAVLVGAALDLAQGFFAPVLVAIVLGVVIAPSLDRLVAFGVPCGLAALASLWVLIASAGLLFLALEPTLSRAIAQAPTLWAEMEDVFRLIRDAVRGVQDLQDSVADALSEDPEPSTTEGQVTIPSLMDALSYGPSLLGGFMVFLGTLFFFLTGRDEIYHQLGRRYARVSHAALYEAERKVSRYFLTITFINLGFGLAVAATMFALGVPEPVLWGVGTFLLNFLLYLGPAMVAVGLLVTGIVTFDGVMSVAPAMFFVGYNIIESQFVTPTLVGRHTKVQPLFIFVSLVFWLWLWGPIGGLVAIPLLVWVLFMTESTSAQPSEAAPIHTAAE
ncbi:MAG: AI-2E family transporter [Pseudomonadota bacterium]